MNPSRLSEFATLLATGHPPGLDGGPRPHVESVSALEEKLDDLGHRHGLAAHQHALIRALVLLWHDHLHAAHAIVQELADVDGALIHGIVHRREPDYWNAKYWFRRVGAHPIDRPLADSTLALATAADLAAVAARLAPGGIWAAAVFVDFVQQCAALPADDPRIQLAVAIQQVESRLLLEHLATLS